MNMEFDWMLKDKVATHVVVSGDHVEATNFIDIPWWVAFPGKTNPTFSDVVALFESRLAPKERFYEEPQLRELFGGEEWDPIRFIRNLHGATLIDHNWIRFADEHDTLNWDNVKLKDWE